MPVPVTVEMARAAHSRENAMRGDALRAIGHYECGLLTLAELLDDLARIDIGHTAPPNG